MSLQAGHLTEETRFVSVISFFQSHANLQVIGECWKVDRLVQRLITSDKEAFVCSRENKPVVVGGKDQIHSTVITNALWYFHGSSISDKL